MKHKTKLKCKQNVALLTYLILMMHSYQLKFLTHELTLVMRKQYGTATVNLVANTLFSTHITTVEYVACYT